MKRHGISRRDKVSSRLIGLVKGKIIRNSKDEFGINKLVTLQKNIINWNFFNSWSPEMAYVLGVIYTDGNLAPEAHYNNLRIPPKISVSQKEPELLEKVLALMGSNAKILFRKQKGTTGGLHYFHISDEAVYEDLLKLGLKPKKSLTLLLLFPDMEAQYIRHFIRGCWDGDGSVYRERKYPNRPCASFVSGSRAFIDGLIEHLVKLGLPNRTVHTYKGGKAFYFRYTGIDCAKLYHILYDEVPERMYLKRKYERFKAIADSFEIKHKSGFKIT
jgi:intein-encoded DNA endonuclease-like protein